MNKINRVRGLRKFVVVQIEIESNQTKIKRKIELKSHVEISNNFKYKINDETLTKLKTTACVWYKFF